jgi:hypothetical protein
MMQRGALDAYLQKVYALDIGRLRGQDIVLVPPRFFHDENTGEHSENMEASKVTRKPSIRDGYIPRRINHSPNRQ